MSITYKGLKIWGKRGGKKKGGKLSVIKVHVWKNYKPKTPSETMTAYIKFY